MLCALFCFGIGETDEARLRSFTGAVERWQADPEFRTVSQEYCVLGSGAMQTRPFFVPARRLIMAIRSIPGLKKEFAVNSTSRLHYDNFSRGPLSSYLHLCGEQDVPAFLAAIEQLGYRTRLTRADLLVWMNERQMDFPIVRDEGAINSLSSLLAEIEPGESFVIRDNLPGLFAPHIAAIANDMGLPTDPVKMTPAQQQAVLDRLDGYIRVDDPQLWRTKQVNDFAGGIWAQVYGPVYNDLLLTFLVIHTGCKYALFLALGAIAWRLSRPIRRRRTRRRIRRRRDERSLAPSGLRT